MDKETMNELLAMFVPALGDGRDQLVEIINRAYSLGLQDGLDLVSM